MLFQDDRWQPSLDQTMPLDEGVVHALTFEFSGMHNQRNLTLRWC